jgi:hypothetical protein
VNSPIPLDSELIRIEKTAFWCCYELTSVFIPSTLEIAGEKCFNGCTSLSSLTFGRPSHLQKLLSVPTGLRGCVAIPDSVEILEFDGYFTDRDGLALVFGSESRLSSVTVPPPDDCTPCRTFLQVSSRSLKLFRAELEFKLDWSWW